MNLSAKDKEGFARREGWSSAISDRRAERKREQDKGKGKGGEVEGNGAHVRVTVSMGLLAGWSSLV